MLYIATAASIFSFCVLVMFGLAYIKIMNIEPVERYAALVQPQAGYVVVDLFENYYCKFQNVHVDSPGHHHYTYEDTGNAYRVIVIQTDDHQNINIHIEYECEIVWLKKTGDTLIAYGF